VGSEAAITAGRATESAAVRAAGALRTGAIRAALLRDESLDVSGVDVNTDEPARRVTLEGRVKNAVQRAAVERIAKEKAPGYTVENKLKIAG
jgi:osmotically-inducible protein OsmY